MKNTQKNIVGWGLALFVGMVIFPPWASRDREIEKVEYGFLFDPPHYGNPSICGPRLALQWFVLGVVCAGLIFMNKEHRIVPSTPVELPSTTTGSVPAAPPLNYSPQGQDSEGVKILKAICLVMGFFFLSTLILGLVLNAK